MGNLGHLPWQQIPRFTPGTTNVDEYVQRLKFIKELWPEDQLHLLGPRAALQVEGSAFQKISRIAPEKLRQADGVKTLVETLGGSWGRTLMEEKYHYFEQAIFQVTQRHDETNDSYLARHDAFFEELLARKVTIEQVRAYVLLRHSQLNPEDKKRVVVESQGNLTYAETVKAIRLLGSKFFGELQNKNSSHSKAGERNKVYDVNFTEEDGQEEAFYSAAQDDEPNDEDLLCYFLEQNDTDAIYIAEFEDSIVEAIQESELAPIYVSYQEARQKLRDKAKARGFWGPSKNRGKGKQSGQAFGRKGKGTTMSWGAGRNRSLADRIANSSCRLCGARGHWKRECPRRPDGEGRDDQRTEVTHYTMEAPPLNAPYHPEILHTLPQDAVLYVDSDESQMSLDLEDEDEAAVKLLPATGGRENLIQPLEALCYMACTPKLDPSPSFREVVARKLLMCARKNGRDTVAATTASARTASERSILSRIPKPSVLQSSSKPKHSHQNPESELAFITTTGAEGVLDTGASRTVVGSKRVHEIIHGLDAACRAGIRKADSDIVFKFGNSGTLKAKHALLLPTSDASWIRVEVIPGDTPLLISNRLLHELDAVIHVRKGYIQLPDRWVPLRKDAKGLSVVDLSALLRRVTAECHQVTTTCDPSRDPAAAVNIHSTEQPPVDQLASAPNPIPDCLSSASKNAGPESQERPEVADPSARPRCGRPTFRGRGQGPQRGADQPRGVSPCRGHPSEWNRDAPRLGRDCAAGRKAQRVEAHGSVRNRLGLCSPHGKEEQPHQPVGEVFQELQHGETSSHGAGRAAGEGSKAAQQDPPGGGREERDKARTHSSEGDRQDQACSKPSGGVGPGGLEAVPSNTNQVIDAKLLGDRQADQHRGHEWRHEGRPDRGSEAGTPDSSGAPAARTRAVEADSRGRGPVSPRSEKKCDQVLHLQQLCKQIDACAVQIEEQLGKLTKDVDFHDWMQYQLPRLDVLEVTLADTNVGNAVRRRSGKVVSIKTFNANKIWQMLNMYEPRHLWIDCGSAIPSKVFGSKTTLRDMYEHQVELGKHFHLCCDRNIFEDSSLAGDQDLQSILEETLCACHSPFEGHRKGRIDGNNFLKRRRFVYTTSRAMHQAVDTRTSQDILPKQQHQQHATTTPRSTTRQLRLADQAANTMLGDHSIPLFLSELLVVDHKREGDFNSSNSQDSLDVAQQVVKRRRLVRKQPPPNLRGQPSASVRSWGELFRDFGNRVINRGRFYFNDGDEVVQATQRLIPHFQVKHVVMARGTNRVQLPKPGIDVRDIPIRQTIVVARQDGKVRIDGEPEQWTKAPKYKRWRSAIPARISLTAYGAPRLHVGSASPVFEPSADPQLNRVVPRSRVPQSQLADQHGHGTAPAAGSLEDVPPNLPNIAQVQSDVTGSPPAGLEVGHPPPYDS